MSPLNYLIPEHGLVPQHSPLENTVSAYDGIENKQLPRMYENGNVSVPFTDFSDSTNGEFGPLQSKVEQTESEIVEFCQGFVDSVNGFGSKEVPWDFMFSLDYPSGNGHSSPTDRNGRVSEPFPVSSEIRGSFKPFQHKIEQTESKILKLWRGYVTHVGEETFFVYFVDGKDKYRRPLFHAEFDKSDLSVKEQEFLVNNAIIKWEIRVKNLPDGNQKKFYNLKLVKFASITKELMEKARARTNKILERYSTHDTTSNE